MKTRYWEERWQEGQIGFHGLEVNPNLEEHWGALGLAQDATVFVPLCGKSLDLHWLRQQGHSVVGNEVSSLAVEAFFAEAETAAMAGDGIRLICRDFFALSSDDLQGATCWYDRAAWIALPQEMQPAYVEQLAALMPPGAVGLFVALEYPQEEMDGPPFSVEEVAVRGLCAGRFDCQVLARYDRSEEEKFQSRGIQRADEVIWRLVRQPGPAHCGS